MTMQQLPPFAVGSRSRARPSRAASSRPTFALGASAPMKRRLALASPFAALALALAPSFAARAASTDDVSGSYREMMMLMVDKARLTAELRTWPEDPTKSVVLKAFKIAVGKAEGDKESEGDNKTPEGIYFAQNHIEGETLPGKYGPLAIPIDFPNPIDQIAHKTGHGIWLHGVDREQRIEEAKVTEGCVAFYNADIDRLSKWLHQHQGVVVIGHDLASINKPDDLAAVKAKTLDWIDGWSRRDLDKYASHYAPDFRFGKYDVRSYRDYKKHVFAGYKTMTVKFDSLRIVAHPKYAVSFFNQDFNGDNRFRSVGRKVLYWEKDAAGEWRIKREVFENRRFESVTYTDAELALLSEPGSSISSGEKDKKAPNL
jgi:murein L,D-transpeptidase YafK